MAMDYEYDWFNDTDYPDSGCKLFSEYETRYKKVMQALARAILRHLIGLWETKQAMEYT
jgi:hypothetical protein